MRRFIDTASLVVIALTLTLFVVALFERGLTHDLLLEAGVFLVSVKLIFMSYKQGLASARNDERLERIEKMLGRLLPPPAPRGPVA
jgi:hypothetical protein